MLQDRDIRTANYRLVQNILNAAKPEAMITPIAEVHQAEEGVFFTIEGTLTSNASGYDTETAFFDSAYVQDSTGGINIFPIAGNYQAGQTVRISGTTSSYNGERQINISTIDVIDPSINPVEPKLLTTTEVKENLGLLAKVEGVITEVTEKEGVIESITVQDDSGEIIVFIDGYIMPSYLMANIEVGNSITAVGLSSISVNDIGETINRIRVRNRSEIVGTPAVDKSDLLALYEQAYAMDLTPYTQESAAALNTEIENALALLNDSATTQSEVDAQIVKLQAAIDGLVELTPTEPEAVDKAELEKLVDSLAGVDFTKYTDESVKALKDQIAASILVLEDENATQSEVDAQITKLQTAITGLVEKAPIVEPTDGVTLVDPETKISIFVPSEAFENEVTLVIEEVERKLDNRDILAYDIYFIDTVTNQKVQPKVEVTVSIPVLSLNTTGLEVLHELELNKYETVSHRMSADKKVVSFEADDFSVYLLSAPVDKPLPDTGQQSQLVYVLMGMMVMSLGAWFILGKKKEYTIE